MFTIKLLFILFILINNSSCFTPTENELKYWNIFKSWMDAYGKSYDPSVIQDKFNSFKDNFDTIIKENSLNQAPYVTVSYVSDTSDKDQLENNFIKRKLLDIDAATSQVEISLPLNNEFQVQSLNHFSDLSHGEFISYYTGLEGGDISIIDPAETGVTQFTKGELAGIIVGSVIGGLALIAALGIIGVKLIKRKTQENKIKKVFKGVNLYDLKPGQHQSITGRGVPINLNK